MSLIYITLEPRYRLADQVPDKRQAVEASSRLDAKLTGANPIDVLIEFPKGASLYDDATLSRPSPRCTTIVEKQAGVGNVWSLDSLRRWLAEKAGKADLATLKQYVDILPEHLTRRFISADKDAVVVSGRIPDVDASQLLPVVQKLDKALDDVRKAHPGYEIAVTGLSAIAARNSADMIGKLNQALTVEIVFVAAFIGLAFRSFVVMLVSILPGIFPVVMAGTVLWAMGEGLQFASVVALTVSFGLGLSATIHFLNRLRLEDKPGADPAIAVEQATILVGPALILTSVVLACGLAVMVFSDLPSLRLFGWLSGLRHAGGADRGPADPAADGDVPQSDWRGASAEAAADSRRERLASALRPSRSTTSEISLPGERIDTFSELPAGVDRQRCVEAHGIGGGLDVAAADLAGQRAIRRRGWSRSTSRKCCRRR